jgi:hypothetical protein
MPAVVGSKQIANFTTHSFPMLGSYLLACFALGVAAVLVWQLLAGRKAALRELAVVPRQPPAEAFPTARQTP